MNEEQKYIDFEAYERVAGPHKRERISAWRTAIGLQDVDGLRVSEYLKETAVKHIEGDITIEEAKELIDSYYKSADGRKLVESDRTEEADKVSARITEILAEKTFSFTPAQLISIHRRLFDGIYKLSGHIRDYNITKNEWVLGGKTVYYASADTISDTLDYDMGQEREFSYKGMNVDDAIRHLSRFCANLWQIHPFCEGNTRTTAVFIIKYLRSLGFNVVNDVFANNSWYFRNALVRANYRDIPKGITETTVYLERFFRSMLLGEQHDLRNRIMHVDWRKAEGSAVQSAKSELQSANTSEDLPLKCKNCTLEEAAVLRIVQKNPTATQKEIAAENGKLYVNYPMIESLKYTKEMPDEEYYQYVVTKAVCAEHKFKGLAEAFAYTGAKNYRFINLDKTTPEEIKLNWKLLKEQNIRKANYICNGENVIPARGEDIAQDKLFEAQKLKYVNENDSVSILNSFPIFIFEYLGK